jgi:parallel beta-helix repeat protein
MLLTAGTAVAALSGTYYIKKGVTSADTFPSFVAAGTALQTQGGLGGNVTFLAFAGTYDEGICYLQSYAGDSTYTTTFDKAPGQGEVILTGTSTSYCFYIYYTNNVKIKNLTLRPTSYGIYSYYSSGTKLQGCKILSGSYGAMMYYAHYDSVVGCNIGATSYGIYFYGTSSPISKHNHASNNFFWGPASYDIYSYYNDSLELYDNTFCGTVSYGIYAYYATRWQIRGNIFKRPSSYCYYFSTGCTLDVNKATLRRNDLYPASSVAYYNSLGYATLAAWQATGYDSLSISADPLCGGGWNPHLKAGSPCINAGDTIAGITTDIDGDSRTSDWPDIGADEYTTAPTGMSGTYTIKQDGSGDYKTFFDAMYDIWGKGFAGDVTFEIYAGTYKEQLRLVDLYNGNYFLTFKAHVGTSGPDQVIISPGAAYAAWLTDASKIKLTDLTFSGYTSYGAYCQALTTTTPYKGCDTVSFRRCIFNGVNPIYFYYSANLDSVVDCQLNAASSYGVYAPGTVSYPSGPLVFINNFIVGFTTYGIYTTYGSGNLYYYNTIYSPSCTDPVYESYYALTAPQYRNNIFYNGSAVTTNYALYLSGTAVPPTSCLNYNCYYYPAGTNIAFVNGAKTWATLRSGGYEANGINRDPKVGGVTNPHLQDNSPCIDSATNISGIDRDIDQEKRDSLPGAGKYDIGADEHTFDWGGPMSGVYTVKQAGGGDFTTLSSAVYALAIRGFAGNVQFDVYNGTYTGMYNLYGMANGNYWLTFRVYPGQSVTLDATGNSYNFYMLANKRVKIQGFRMTGATTAGVYMYANTSVSPYNGCDTCVIASDTIYAPYGIYNYYSDDDTLTGNKIVASSSYGMYLTGYTTVGSYTKRNFITNNDISGYTSYGIYSYCQDSVRIKNNTLTGTGSYSIYSYYGSYDTIANNTLSGSSYGVYAYGYSSAPYSRCNIIANNTISATSYCIYTYYQDTLRIKNNTTNSGSGIMSYYGNNDSIYNNFINATSSYGIYLYGTSTSPYSVNNVVVNNMIRGFTSYGLYMYYQSNPQIVYNAFRGTGSYAFYCGPNYGRKIHDNIFLANTYAMYNLASGDTFPLTEDNNDYRLNGGGTSVIYHAPSGALTLAAWKALSGKDLNSTDADPQFVSASDLHLAVTSPCINAGQAYPPFTTDIDGDSRTVNTPDIGADEVLVDVATRSIIKPTGGYKAGDSIVPSAAFKHVAGRGAATYYVKMVITQGTTPIYADSASRTTSPGDSIVVNFATFVPTVADTNYHATCCHLIACDTVPANDTARSNFTVAPVDVGVYGILAPVGQVWRDQPVNPRVVLRNNGTFPATFNARFTIDQGSVLERGASAPVSQPVSQGLTGRSGNSAPAGKTVSQGSTAQTGASGLVGKTVSQGSTVQAGAGVQVGKTMNAGSAPQGSARSGQATSPGATTAPTGSTQSPGAGQLTIDALVYDTTQSVTLGAGAQETLTFTKSWIPSADGPHTGACQVTLLYDSDSTNNYMESDFTVQHVDVGAAALLSPSGTLVKDTVVSPTVVIKSYGTADAYCSVRCIIASGSSTVYDTAEAGILLAAGDSITHVFAKTWTANPIGDYTVTAYTTSALDIYPANDTAHSAVSVVQIDLDATAVLAPIGHIVENDSVDPSVVIKSYGASDATFDVRCIIQSGPVTAYDTTETGVFLAAGDSVTLVFAKAWEASPVGPFTVTAYTVNPFDRNPANDTAFGVGTVTSSAPPGWSELAPLPGSPTASGRLIKDGGCLAYDAATDLFYASKGNKTGEFYAFDVRAGAWTSRAGIPLGAEAKQSFKGSVLCSDGNRKLYLTKGNNTIGFWEYDAAQNAWTQKTNVPLGPSRKKVKQGAALAWATTNGVGHVYLLKGYRNEFYKYDPASNAWTQLLNAPIGPSNHVKWDAGSWMLPDPEPGAHMLYAFKGKYHEFYAYDTDADSWLLTPQLTPMPIRGTNGSKKAKDGSCAAWYDGVIYALKGGNTTELWRYFVNGDSWRPQLDIPLFGTSGSRKKVKNGGAMAAYPSTGVYCFKGNKSNEFWRFRPLWEAEAAQPSRDGVTAGTTEIGSVSFAIAPNPLSGGLATMRYSLPRAGLATLNVFDVTGRTVLTQTLAAGRAGTASLDLRKLGAGVYLVKVTTEGFSTTQKLVVEH